MIEITTNIKTEIGKNQDAENDTRNVQAQFIEADDLQIVEQVQLAGFESNPPVGTKHLTTDLGGGWKQSFAENDGIAPDATLEPGESKIYSSDAGAVKASMVFKKDGKTSWGNGTDEVLDLFDQLLTLLQGSVDSPGTASTGTNSLILGDLVTLQTALGNLKI